MYVTHHTTRDLIGTPIYKIIKTGMKEAQANKV